MNSIIRICRKNNLDYKVMRFNCGCDGIIIYAKDIYENIHNLFSNKKYYIDYNVYSGYAKIMTLEDAEHARRFSQAVNYLSNLFYFKLRTGTAEQAEQAQKEFIKNSKDTIYQDAYNYIYAS